MRKYLFTAKNVLINERITPSKINPKNMMERYFISFCNSNNWVYLSNKYKISTNSPEAINALKIPFKIPLQI